MTLNEAFSHIIKTPENEVKDIVIYDFAEEIGISFDNYDTPLPDNIKGYWLSPWKSKDMTVGISLFFIDDEPLAVVIKTASDSPTSYEFCSEDVGMKLADTIISIGGQSDEIDIYIGEDMDDDNEGDNQGQYTVSRTSNLLLNEGYYQGEKVTISKTFEDEPDDELWRKAIVTNLDGNQVEIHMDDFYIPCKIK